MSSHKKSLSKMSVSRRSFVKAVLGALGIGVPTSAVAAATKDTSAATPSPGTPDGDEVTYFEAANTANQVPIHARQLDTTNNPPAIRITNVASGLDIQSVNAGSFGAGSFAFMSKNGDGDAVSAGDSGFIDAAGKFRKSTTANSTGNWCVAVTGGASDSDVYLARRGRVKMRYTGSAPSAGDYLVTSSSTGMAQAESILRPQSFAVCLSGGSSGIVEALLLTQRSVVPFFSERDIFRFNFHSGTTFTGSIAAISGSDVEYTVVSGNEDSIRPKNQLGNPHLGKVVLHNLTRGNSALITDGNLSNTPTPADGTVTLTSSVPGNWQVGDSITCNSQTNTSTVFGHSFYDIDLNNPDNDTIPENAVSIMGELTYQEEAVNNSCLLHTYEANDDSKRRGFTSVNNINHTLRGIFDIPIVDQKFTVLCMGSGAGTSIALYRISQVVLAEP